MGVVGGVLTCCCVEIHCDVLIGESMMLADRIDCDAADEMKQIFMFVEAGFPCGGARQAVTLKDSATWHGRSQLPVLFRIRIQSLCHWKVLNKNSPPSRTHTTNSTPPSPWAVITAKAAALPKASAPSPYSSSPPPQPHTYATSNSKPRNPPTHHRRQHQMNHSA